MRGVAILLLLVLTACSVEPDAGEKGVLKIVTEPGDAKIYINSKRKGNSPAEKDQTFAIQLAEGEYKIEAIKPGGRLEELYGIKSEVFVAEDSVQTITLKLEKRPSQVFQEQFKAQYGEGAPEPEMVAIPGGHFRMGCVSGKGCDSGEGPVHSVTLKPFYLAKTEVTFTQYDACVASGGCAHLPEDEGWGSGERPVINVNWDDAQKYIQWLNQRTGKHYRLPTEAEWEYAARAGSETQYSWGDKIGHNQANCDGCGSQWDNKQTAPVGKFPANAFGLQDLHGNVREWTQDCWNYNYNGAPMDGSAWEQGDCSQRVFRGGSWAHFAVYLRSAYRWSNSRESRYYFMGFRLASDAR